MFPSATLATARTLVKPVTSLPPGYVSLRQACLPKDGRALQWNGVDRKQALPPDVPIQNEPRFTQEHVHVLKLHACFDENRPPIRPRSRDPRSRSRFARRVGPAITWKTSAPTRSRGTDDGPYRVTLADASAVNFADSDA
jgi:hypothetical protein